jgi:hypothetical protein
MFVHIGMNKTGSSTLQRVLNANRERLAEQGLDYLDLGRSGVNHHPIALELSRGTQPVLWPRIREYVARSRRDVVLSSEAFEGVPAATLREAIGDVARAKIIFYVRPTVDRLPSFYNQNTKYGLNVDDFDTFFDQQHVEVHAHWRYATFARSWVDAFNGSHSVRVRSLDRRALAGGDLLTDFLDACERGRDAVGSLIAPDAHMENVSPGWKLVETLRGLHGRVVGRGDPLEKMQDPKLWPYLQRAFTLGSEISADMGWTERRAYLSDEQYELLTRNYEEDRAEIAKSVIDQKLSPVERGRDDYIREVLPGPELVPDDEQAEFLARLTPELLRFQLHQLRTL